MGSFGPVRPILRMFDIPATRRFYVDYVGFAVDREVGEGDRPVFWQVSLGEATLWLSSHHDDGTPGTAVVVFVEDVVALHTVLRGRDYPFLAPGVEEGPLPGSLETTLIDPASNRLRFFQPGPAASP
jgi:ribosomal-protein-alanine N-acetyltransferase